MAYKDSDEIATNSNYALGDYRFRIERSSVPGSSNDKIEAICTDKDGHNARKSIQVPSFANIESWYVEANETEATVYVVLKDSAVISAIQSFANGEPLGREGQPVAWRCPATPHIGLSIIGASVLLTQYNGIIYSAQCTAPTIYFLSASSGGSTVGSHMISNQTNYFSSTGYSTQNFGDGIPTSLIDPQGKSADYANVGGVKLVGRFAIDLEDAGGVGPGSDWIDPGDYDPDWEEGDPTHTLYVTVTGALSGRHNDPIEDPSYSYIPADKDTVKDYGCGGDGGHGGGGGAGASTVVIHKFATNQANSKEVTAIARRHGYGSGGGKGGKGGDGCILVYY